MSGAQIIAMQDEYDSQLTFEKTKTTITVNHDLPDKFIATYYLTQFHGCDSIFIQFYCSDCIDNHLEDIFNVKGEKWVKIDKDLYISTNRTEFNLSLSKQRLSTVKYMRLTQTPEEEVCTTVAFSLKEMKTTDWKKLIK